ncbi:MAG: endonuclease [Bacteroidota bacterium]
MKTLRSTAAILIWLLFSTVARAQPPGYYTNAAGKTGVDLQVALYNIIKNHTSVTYTPGVWNAYYTTDVKPNGKVWDIYSDVPGGTPPYEYTLGSSQCGTSTQEGDCYSREHSFPQSYFGGLAPMVTDLFHIFPTDQYVNGTGHSNHPYGTVLAPTYTSLNGSKRGPCTFPGYTGTVFEPIDAYKGDIARAYFYMATCYENLIAGWKGNNTEGDVILDGTSYPAFKTWYVNLLLAWNAADPVSQKEIDRNNAVYAIQNNRNPYIDHPEYVSMVWGTASGLSVTPGTITGSGYTVGAGSSPSQSYTLSGTTLSPASGNITVTGSTDFEVSTNNSTFGNTATLVYTASTLANTAVYVRLRTGLSTGNYNNELVANTGGASSAVNVNCSGVVAPATLPEPTNYASNFSAHNIHLQWVDATGTIVPTGYLIRMSSVGFSSIAAPVDGTPVANSATDLNVAYGQQSAWFTSLNPNTTYYFKMYAYTGSGSAIDYKTSGTVPQLQQNTGL